MRRFLLSAVTLAACLLVANTAHAQLQMDTDSQRFIVIVPGNVQIIAPGDVLIVHNTMNTPQVFPPQQWEVRGNVLSGVTTTFEVMTPFVHFSNPADTTLWRDADLQLAIASVLGPATWNVDIANDTTMTPGDPDALVQISSNDVGWAFVDLTVTFVDTNFSLLMSGSYETTVVGTVTENP